MTQKTVTLSKVMSQANVREEHYETRATLFIPFPFHKEGSATEAACRRAWQGETKKGNANGTGNYFMSSHGHSRRHNVLLLFLK
jgi:hypothetical protein